MNKNKPQKPNKFANKVIAYLESEWRILFEKQSQDIRNKILTYIYKMQNQGNNVPNIAADIATSIIPV
jgi:hypothetical protein